ncbi:MAG: lysine--tRNA ligase, partial [Patescibacteria group bacterium]
MSSFWLDRVVAEARPRARNKTRLVVRDEKTASGRIHVGSLRGVVIHGAVSRALSEAKLPSAFFYEINDFDPFDDIPSFLNREEFERHLGKPLFAVPAPDLPAPAGALRADGQAGGTPENYAEYFGGEFIAVIKRLGFAAEFYRASALYREGRMNDAIRIALLRAPLIARIYEEVSGAKREKNWLPVSLVCEHCGKIGTTKALSFDGERVKYECGNFVEWAVGCGRGGAMSPYNGGAKLLWKAEWAAKFFVLGVDVEGAGKDHSTKGGAREIADRIAREVYDIEPPVNIPYEFFHVGGRKMSTSRGAGASAREIAELLPPKLLRFLMLYKDPARVIDFDPSADTIPNLYDTYDSYAEEFWKGGAGDYAKIFRFSHPRADARGLGERFLPRFSEVAYLVQMPHLEFLKEIEKMAGRSLMAEDKQEAEERAFYARRWLESCAPEKYKFEIQKALPAAAKALREEQRKALARVRALLEANPMADGQTLHGKLHELKTELGIAPKDFFSALYLSLLGKESGPKAGWFLSVLDRDFLLKRLREAS